MKTVIAVIICFLFTVNNSFAQSPGKKALNKSQYNKLTEAEKHVIEDKGTEVIVTSNLSTYTTSKFFNSTIDISKLENNKKHPLLKQHFIGWFIKTSNPVFNVNCATFMDFSIPQKGNTRFMYVLPFSEREALVEYTLFSSNLLQENEYLYFRAPPNAWCIMTT